MPDTHDVPGMSRQFTGWVDLTAGIVAISYGGGDGSVFALHKQSLEIGLTPSVTPSAMVSSRHSVASLRPIMQTTTGIASSSRFDSGLHELPPHQDPLQWRGRRIV